MSHYIVSNYVIFIDLQRSIIMKPEYNSLWLIFIINFVNANKIYLTLYLPIFKLQGPALSHVGKSKTILLVITTSKVTKIDSFDKTNTIKKLVNCIRKIVKIIDFEYLKYYIKHKIHLELILRNIFKYASIMYLFKLEPLKLLSNSSKYTEHNQN